jgi:hypothetical protein
VSSKESRMVEVQPVETDRLQGESTSETAPERRRRPKRRLLLQALCLLPSFTGVSCAIFPYFDGWSEIFWPRVAYWWKGAIVIWLTFYICIVPLVIVQILCLVLAVRKKWSPGYKLSIIILSAILASAALSYWYGPTGTERRVASFPAGAWTRLMMAGGAARFRDQVLRLADTTTSPTPAESEWPDSVKRVGAYLVEVDETDEIVAVYVPSLGDTFGFLVQDPEAPPPEISYARPGFPDDPEHFRGHRLWKLAEGVFFFEKW